MMAANVVFLLNEIKKKSEAKQTKQRRLFVNVGARCRVQSFSKFYVITFFTFHLGVF